MNEEDKKDLISYLGNYMTEERRELIDRKLSYRTRFLTVILEDIYNPHNASAVVRSCECFGIQDLHVVEQRNDYTLNPGVTVGSSKWITLYRYNDPKAENIQICYESLKSAGYTILATTPDPEALPLNMYKMTNPVALSFGTEMRGHSEYAKEAADEFIHIPMRGFTESFNISVSAAICLYELSGKLIKSDLPWQLNETQKLDLKLKWYRGVIRNWKMIEKEFFKIRQETK